MNRSELRALARTIYLSTEDTGSYSTTLAADLLAEELARRGLDPRGADELIDEVADEMYRAEMAEHAWMGSYVREARDHEREGDTASADLIKRTVCS